MNEKFNKIAKVEQLTKMFSSREEEKGLIVKDPLKTGVLLCITFIKVTLCLNSISSQGIITSI